MSIMVFKIALAIYVGIVIIICAILLYMWSSQLQYRAYDWALEHDCMWVSKVVDFLVYNCGNIILGLLLSIIVIGSIGLVIATYYMQY
jgi:hypothetical protein